MAKKKKKKTAKKRAPKYEPKLKIDASFIEVLKLAVKANPDPHLQQVKKDRLQEE